MTLGGLWRTAAAHVRHRALRRAGVPAGQRRWMPAWCWAVVAFGLATGPWLPDGPSRLAIPAALLAAAATRPGRGWVLWVAVALAVVIGGQRADAIDRAARPPDGARSAAGGGLNSGAGEAASQRSPSIAAPPGRPGASRDEGWKRVTLTEALAAGGEGGASALGVMGGHKVIVTATRFGPPSPAMARGEIAEIRGTLVELGREGNDARLRRLGVSGRVLTAELRATGARRGGPLGAIDRFAVAAQRTLTDAVGARRGALLAGMALGSDDRIGESDQAALRTAGLWHLVAASGGNIALVVGLVMAVGWLVGLSLGMRLVLCAVAICAYVPLAGGGPSIQRAGVMGLAGLLALALGREHRGADALALAAAATLVVDPRATLDIGWQLSFAAAAALIGLAPWVARMLGRLGMPRWLAVGVGCSLVATVATAPISLVAFGELSLIGLVANALVLPLVGVAVWSGALAAVFTPIAPSVAEGLAQPGGVAAGLTLAVADWAQQRSYAVVGWQGAAAAVVAASLLGVLRPGRGVVVAVLGLAFVALSFTVPRPPGEPRVLVLDIGQGNATLLQDGEDGVLVDAGPQDGGVVQALRRSGVRRLRAVILSHPAADHDGGAAAAIESFPTDLLIDGGTPGGGPTHDAAVRVARRRGARIVPARVGQQVAFGAIALRLRWPTARASAAPGDPNDRAAVVQAQIGALRVLLPADAEGNVLTTLASLRSDVLIVSHHGSNDPQLPSVLRRLHPQLAVISLGTPNSYGHPTPATLAALRSARVPTLRTDRDGTLDIRADTAGHVAVRRVPTRAR